MIGRRAGVLLETLVALAVFVTVGAFILAASRGSLGAARVAGLESRGADLAASALAAIEAGLVPVSALSGGDRLLVAMGFEEPGAASDFFDAETGSWTLEVEQEPAGIGDLTLIAVTAVWTEAGADAFVGVGPETAGDAGANDAGAGFNDGTVRVTVRGLVSLADVERWAPEEDELLEGLPGVGAGDGGFGAGPGGGS